MDRLLIIQAILFLQISGAEKYMNLNLSHVMQYDYSQVIF